MGALPKFTHLSPHNQDELFNFMQKYKGRYLIKAGGTDIIPNAKKRLYDFEFIISLSQLKELDFIEYNKKLDQIRLGALTTLTSIINHKIINKLMPSVVAAAKTVAAPPIRNSATIGGNICLNTRCFYYNQSYMWRQSRQPCFKLKGKICNAVKGSNRCMSVFAADMPAILIALDAYVVIGGLSGDRVCKLEKFYTGKGVKPNILQQCEYVKEILIEKISLKEAIYKKFRIRNALDFPICAVAAGYNKSNAKYTVVLNAVDSKPVVISQLDTLEAGLSQCEKSVHPIDNFYGTPSYRKSLTTVLLKKIIERW